MSKISDVPVPSWRLAVQTAWLFLRNLCTDFVAHGCQKSAAALTYLTLFAIVPLMTVVYSVFSLIPAFDGVADQLQDLLFSHFVPESGQELRTYLTEFSSQARSLTAVGVGMLVVTAYWMLSNIEKTFNAIWGVTRARKGVASFLLYWAVLSIGPLLLGVGLAINTYVLSLKLVFKEYDTLGVSSVVFQTLPFVLTVGAFTLLFVAVPNCRVPFRHGLVGGLITTIAFQLLKNVFSALVAGSSFRLVYGAFAAVPLFLLWINLAWTLILAGAILVRALAERGYLVNDDKLSDMTASLKCLALLRERSLSGNGVSDGDCYRLGIGVVHWQRLRALLEKAKWLAQTASGKYVLTRDLRHITLWDLAGIVGVRLHDLDPSAVKPGTAPWLDEYRLLRSQLADNARQIFGVSLEELLCARTEALPKPLPLARE